MGLMQVALHFAARQSRRQRIVRCGSQRAAVAVDRGEQNAAQAFERDLLRLWRASEDRQPSWQGLPRPKRLQLSYGGLRALRPHPVADEGIPPLASEHERRIHVTLPREAHTRVSASAPGWQAIIRRPRLPSWTARSTRGGTRWSASDIQCSSYGGREHHVSVVA